MSIGQQAEGREEGPEPTLTIWDTEAARLVKDTGGRGGGAKRKPEDDGVVQARGKRSLLRMDLLEQLSGN